MPASIPQRNTEFIWIWGLTLHDTVSFLGNIFALIISIICTIVIVICAHRIISTALKNRKRDKRVEFVERIWLITGFIIIVVMIIWIFSIHYLITYTVSATEKEGSLRTTTITTYRFWAYNTIGFGVIGVILGGCLSIIGACIKGLNLPKEA
jgi:heme/copper-type cytochrome/quinol oxidase subunit 2